jgi:DNA-binding GntR family transcriptional regulator
MSRIHADAKTARLLEVSNNAPLLKTSGRVFRGDGEVLHTCSQVGYGEDFDFIIR